MPQSPLLHTAHYFFAQLMPKTVKVSSHCRPLRTILTSQGPARSCPAPETSFLKLTTKRSCAIARKRDAHPLTDASLTKVWIFLYIFDNFRTWTKMGIFACIHSRQKDCKSLLVNCAYTFSPLV